MTSIASPALWAGFNSFIVLMLVLDLLVFHRKAHEVNVREALGWTAFWIAIAVAFGGLLYMWFGLQTALEFGTGYVIEKALSVDNLFVFLVIFSYFKVPKLLQHRVLYWGIFGALILRIAFILAGTSLIQRFHFVIYIFGAFLVYTGIKLLRDQDDEVDPEDNPVLKLLRKWVPSVPDYRGPAFFVVENGKRLATPLFFVLVVIETSDVVFAVDSIPAIFAVTQDPFLVYSSNIFAILGLRALYFALAAMMGKFRYLQTGLAFVLLFVGTKMLIADFYHVPVAASLGVIVLLLVGSVALSLLRPPSEEDAASNEDGSTD